MKTIRLETKSCRILLLTYVTNMTWHDFQPNRILPFSLVGYYHTVLITLEFKSRLICVYQSNLLCKHLHMSIIIISDLFVLLWISSLGVTTDSLCWLLEKFTVGLSDSVAIFFSLDVPLVYNCNYQRKMNTFFLSC